MTNSDPKNVTKNVTMAARTNGRRQGFGDFDSNDVDDFSDLDGLRNARQALFIWSGGMVDEAQGGRNPRQDGEEEGDVSSADVKEHISPLPYDATAFPDGVSSGDVTRTSAVLWARASKPGVVAFQISNDPGFHHVIGTGEVNIVNTLVPAKFEVDGLHPDHRYYYRVIDADAHVAEGTLETSPKLGQYKGFTFGVFADSRGNLAPYPSIENAPTAGLDLLIKLGDVPYADPFPFGSPAQTLQEFQIKNNEIYSSHLGINSWAALQSTTPILSTIDDHEVRVDFAGGALASSDPRFAGPRTYVNDTALYDNGITAFEQYNAIQSKTYSGTGDPRFDGKPDLYRYDIHGSDAAIFMLDTRSFRDAQLPEASPTAPLPFLAASFNPRRTMLGGVQLDQLEHDLLDAQSKGITWKFVNVSVPIQNFGPIMAADRFEGYAAERDALLKFINDNHIENVVFVSADFHTFSVNNLTYQDHLGGPQIATSAIEVDTMAIASGLNVPQIPALLAQAGVLPSDQLALYNQLPPVGKDDFLKTLIDKTFLAPIGYDPIGLDDNLAIAAGKVHAQLLQGSYFVSNDFGWTKFKVDPDTQNLLVTTYGIPGYTAADLAANPAAILARTPTIVSQFLITPTLPANSANFHITSGNGGTVAIKDTTVPNGGIVQPAPAPPFPRHGIDLLDIASGAQTTLAYAENAIHTGGTLTMNGRHATAIALLGNYMAASFGAAAHGHGGSLITEAPQTGTPLVPLTTPHTG
jgi:alkaline phosphatase D